MPFTPKDWRDYPETSTPITAAALEDLETRVTAYADIAGVAVEDEGVALTRRATLNFVGSGVRAQDSGGTTRVTIDRQQQVNNVLDFGAKGDWQTDDTAAIQAAIDNLFAGNGNSSVAGGVVYFPPNRRYKTSAPLNLDNRANVTLLGGGAAAGGSAIRGDHTTEDLITARSSVSCRFINMGFMTGSGFTGKLLNADHLNRYASDGAMTSGSATLTASLSFNPRDVYKNIVVTGAGAGGTDLATTIASYISPTQVTLAAPAGTTVTGKKARIGNQDTWGLFVSHCWFYGAASSGVTACISLDGAAVARIENSDFGAGQIGILGRASSVIDYTAGSGYSNAVAVDQCYFSGQGSYPIKNPFQNWKITNNTIEPMADGNGRFVYCDTNAPAQHLLVSGNWWGDLGAYPQSGVFVEANGYGINVVSNYLQGTADTVGVRFNNTSQGVVIQGNYFEGQTPCVDRNSKTVSAVTITGNSYNNGVGTKVAGATGFTGNSMVDDGGAGIYFAATAARH